MSASTITRITLSVAQPVAKTRWCLLQVETAEGVIGCGEATMQKLEDEIFRRADTLLRDMIGRAADPVAVRRLQPSDDLATAALLSAMSHALWDLQARRDGVPVAEAMGDIINPRVPLYANINRRTIGRTPEDFAESARLALRVGFEAIKIAPFDEVTPEAKADGREFSALAPGIERIAAVRDAIGPDRDLMVDCHWRLTPAGARQALAEVRRFCLYWFECPLPETDAAIPDLKLLRGLANGQGTRLAGCEGQVGVAGFERYVAAGAYDVVMPDVKYVGSMEEMLALARRLDGSGVALSPHNPSGPVSHAASLHVCAVAPGLTRLEMQFDETPVFWSLAGGALPAPVAGASPLPAGPGLGLSLDPAVLAQFLKRTAAYS